MEKESCLNSILAHNNAVCTHVPTVIRYTYMCILNFMYMHHHIGLV